MNSDTLPREAVETPSLEAFKRWVDMALGSLLWVTLILAEGLDHL